MTYRTGWGKTIQLRTLILEDNAFDAELVERELRRTGLDCLSTRAETKEEFLAALAELPDLILADYRVPGFGALAALRALRLRGLDVPVIVVTGSLGDEAAVECLREGATDYLLKDRLGRLGQAIRNSVEQVRLRQEQRRTAEALRASEEKFRLLFAEAPHPMWVVAGESLRFLEVNHKATEHYGYSREEFLAMTLRDIRPPEDAAAMCKAASRVAGGQSKTGTWRHLTKAGEVREVSVASHPLIFNGQSALLAVVDDVTDRKRLEAQLLQSQKMEAVGQLAGGVAHDFNNLLTLILSYAQLAAGQLATRPEVLGQVEQIRKAGERAAALTRQLLAFSRNQVLQPRVVDLNSVVAGIESMLRRLIGEDVELLTALRSLDGHALIDPGQLEQVIVNLAINARDAMPGGGRLILETSDVELDALYVARHPFAQKGPHVLVAVSDTGHGMDAGTRSRIFEPFFTTKAPGKGTGLGLSMVYGIVRQSGGHVEVYSEPGEGSTFKIYFPRVAGAATGIPVVAEGARSPARGAETILLVEDEAALRELIRGILESGGYTVLDPESAEAALQRAERHDGPVHLLLTDVIMPGLSGPETAARLAKTRPEARVIYMSGYTANIIEGKVLQAGAHFLEKPFTAEGLLRKVRDVLDGGSNGRPSLGR